METINPKIKEYKICTICKEELHRFNFYEYAYITKQGKRSKRLAPRCKSCSNDYRNKLVKNSPEYAKKVKETAKAWRTKNTARIKVHKRERQKDPEVRAQKAAHQRLRQALKRESVKKLTKEERKTLNLIYKKAKDLETKLRACVDCDDDLELQIHVDHIIPLSIGGTTHPSNLQLLSGKENLTKHAQAYCVLGAPRFG